MPQPAHKITSLVIFFHSPQSEGSRGLSGFSIENPPRSHTKGHEDKEKTFV
jgi:hypothetical protein